MARDNPNHRSFVDNFTDRERNTRRPQYPNSRTRRSGGDNKPENSRSNLPAERRTTQPTERRTNTPATRGSNAVAPSTGRGGTSVRQPNTTVRSTPPAEGMRTVGSSSTVTNNRLTGPSSTTTPRSSARTPRMSRGALGRLGAAGLLVGMLGSQLDSTRNPDSPSAMFGHDALRRDTDRLMGKPSKEGTPRTSARTSSRDHGTKVGAGREPKPAAPKPQSKPATKKPEAKKTTPASENRLSPNATLGGAIEFFMRRDGLTRQQAAAKAKANGYK